ncbi:hypothetical protein AVEN_96521-1 [Araneus ventricosus]|uniref:Uncharacterized protein n=1 Tax=Araneus ventricosus TaxID=182803 RepID=A0A4Y2CTV9_ARAVE|nr:hypothetical protein AVEN_96521-1 [Araneus ventricosus]
MDDEIFSQTIYSPYSDAEEVDVPADTNIIAAQAKDAVHIMFMECSENVEKEDFEATFWIENLVEKKAEAFLRVEKEKYQSEDRIWDQKSREALSIRESLYQVRTMEK